jgi:AcrR family transcriptional regulator
MNKRIRNAEMRRAQILSEATELIGRRGYHAFVLQDLAKRCGLTNGGLLYHFPSKERLLLAVLEERDRQIAHELIATFGSRMRTETISVVLGVLHDIVKAVAAQPALTRLYVVLQAEALDPAHPAHDHFAAREKAALEGFAALVAAHVADPSAAARQIHALIDGLSLQWLREKQGFDLVASWDQAVARLQWTSSDKQ